MLPELHKNKLWKNAVKVKQEVDKGGGAPEAERCSGEEVVSVAAV